MFNGHEDPDFAFGQMYGIRSFKVSSTTNPFLTAVTYSSFMYQPGENLAGCIKFDTGPDGEVNNQHSGWARAQFWMDNTGSTHRLSTHRVAANWCDCGFYGYYDRRYNQYANIDTITGIVAAYGRISYSNRGFRASRLKIVAAVNPFLSPVDAEQGPVIPLELAKRLASGERWANPSRWLKIRAGGCALIAVNTFATIAAAWTSASLYSWLGWVVNFILIVANGLTPYLEIKATQKYRMAINENAELVAAYHTRLGHLYRFEQNGYNRVSSKFGPPVFDKIAMRYPEIKWYASVEEMIAAHSLTKYKDTPGYTQEPNLRRRFQD